MVYGRDLLANLVPLSIINFDVILGMDWLSTHYATLDCRNKKVFFHIPKVDEFSFDGDKNGAPYNLVSTISARKILRRGCQSYLALVTDTSVDSSGIDNAPIVKEFPYFFFLKELLGLPPNREIEFCIDTVSNTNPISMSPYRMALAKLKELSNNYKSF